ncbi:glycosyl transferase [Paractinoplanes deccanensis]|uniref:Glycosyl transferase n=1 Tax=Paractinoplanes deccanensis TaxID=113561 RepID=A0ABQ3Y2W4_9ACTN|nr:glycosyltransferase [Actinoplanes deccanensis]GID74320.1 glycosyl transferase [Actinoplanes deccanensis]
MRILVVSAPLLGHVFPLVPLARVLRDAGHDVLVATAGDALAVGQAGLAVHDVAPGLRFGPVAARVALRHPLLARSEMAGRAGTRMVGKLFAAVNERMARGLAEATARHQPALVVHEPLAVPPRGVPAVLHENSLYDGPALVSAVDPQAPPPAAIISIAPPSVLPGRSGLPMRAVPYAGEGAPPPELTAPPRRARVLVSRSTVPGPGRDRLMRTVVAAAAEVDADFVLLRPDVRGPLPANVTATGWAPIPDVLAQCAGIVHHGGAGTTLAALHAGVPQLVTNGPGDRRHNAGLVARRGAGLALDERDITPAALTRLITDGSLAKAAAEVRDEMAAMPGPETVVEVLARLG